MGHSEYDPVAKEQRPWNAGRKLGAKRALKAQQVWAIRFWLDRERRLRDLAIDSKLRGCDIVKIKIGDLVNDRQVRSRAIVVQQKGHGWLRQPIDGSGLDGPGPTRKAVRSVGGRPQSHLRLALGGLDEKLFETKRAIMRASIGRLRSAPALLQGDCDRVTCRDTTRISAAGWVDERRDRERLLDRNSLGPDRALSPL